MREKDAEIEQLKAKVAALERAGADHCLPLTAIAPLINRLCLQ